MLTDLQETFCVQEGAVACNQLVHRQVMACSAIKYYVVRSMLMELSLSLAVLILLQGYDEICK